MSPSSNLRQNSSIIRSDVIGTRIIAEVPVGKLESGTTAGDVLRNGFSGATSFYFRAGATSSDAARVFGVVENIQDSSAFVVLQGLIDYPDTLIAGAPSAENFYLSAATAGKIQSYAPAASGQISKKVLQQTSVGAFNAAVIGPSDGSANVGTVEASKTSDAPVGTVLPYLSVTGNTAAIPEGWVDGSTMQYLPVSEYSEYNTQFGDIFGYEETLSLSHTTSEFSSALIGKAVKTDRPGVDTAIVVGVDAANKKLTIRENRYDRPLYSAGITAGSTPLLRFNDLIGYINSGVHDKNATPQLTHNTSNLAEPVSIQGYYPLYFTPNAAAAASPDDSGYHMHGTGDLGSTYDNYYMPNGLAFGSNQNPQFHGNSSVERYVHDGSHDNPATDYLMAPTGTAIQTLYTMKVKNIVAVDIPSQVTIQTLNVTHGLSAGSSANNVVTTDVAYDVQCMKNRIRDLEIRIMGSEQSCSL